MKYVALLRGINVGWHRKVDMNALRKVFEDIGFTHVQTYINSGNVIFCPEWETHKKELENIREKIESMMVSRFGFPVSVMLRSRADIMTTIEAVPQDWIKAWTYLPQVVFLSDDLDRPDILDSLSLGVEHSSVRYTPWALIWNMETDTYTKSPLYKYISKKDISQKVTVRTTRTVQKLGDMMM